MAMLCGSISGVAICLRSEEDADAMGAAAVAVPDEDEGVDVDELVEAAAGGGGGRPGKNVGFFHMIAVIYFPEDM